MLWIILAVAIGLLALAENCWHQYLTGVGR
jgi:hypothetical protein